MFDNNSSNWREALNSHYQEAEYQELLQTKEATELAPGTRKILDGRLFVSSDNSVTHEPSPLFDSFEGFRFPKVPRPAQLVDLRTSDYVLADHVSIDALQKQSTSHSSILLEECYAGLRFLEAMLRTFANKTAELRHSLVEHTEYLATLSRPPQDQEDTEYIQNTIFNNLATLYDELQELFTEMNVFQATKIHEMIDTDTEAFDQAEPIYALKDSLIARSTKLADEVTLSIFAIEHLVSFTNSLIRFPLEDTPLIEACHTRWEEQQRHYKRLSRSALSETFLIHMVRQQLPVCEAMYSFLETCAKVFASDHSEVALQLVVENYHFARNEFKQIVQFLKVQNLLCQNQKKLSKSTTSNAIESAWNFSVLKSLRSVIIRHCSFSDQDCHALSVSLDSFESLSLLDLSHNRLSYSGIASLCTHWYENKDNSLTVLNLSHNRLDTECVSLLAQVLRFLPRLQSLSLSHNHIGDKGMHAILKGTLNPYRKKFLSIPKKSELSSNRRHNKKLHDKDGFDNENDDEDNDDDDDDDDGDDDDQVESQLRHRPRYPSSCYWQDFFLRELERRHAEEEAAAVASDGEVVNADWVNTDEEEFDMDLASNYSVDDEENTIYSDDGEAIVEASVMETQLETAEEKDRERVRQRKRQALLTLATPLATDNEKRLALRGFSFREKLILVDPSLSAFSIPEVTNKVAQAAHLRLALEQEVRRYPRFVQCMLRIRLKLVAISMFQRVRVRSVCELQALHVAHCGLSPNIMPTLVFTAMENSWLRELRLAENGTLLSTFPACKLMGELIEHSEIVDLDISHCGLREAGLMLLSPSMEKSLSLRSIDLSANQLGPTAANVIANLHKQFYSDVLQLGPSLRVKSAPSLQQDLQEKWDWDELVPPVNETKKDSKLRRKEKLHRRGRTSSDGESDSNESTEPDEDSTFVDRDLFDGDEEEDDSFFGDGDSEQLSKAMDLL
jgi:hypothetical protein